MHKHFNARNYLRSTLLRQFHQASLGWIVNHVEDVSSVNLVLIQRRFASIPHPHRSGIDDHVESQLLQVCPLDGPCPRPVSQFFRWTNTSIEDINLSSTFLESED